MLQGRMSEGHVLALRKCESLPSLVFLLWLEVTWSPRKKYDRQPLYMFQYFGVNFFWNRYLHRSLFDGKTGQILRF